MSFTPFPPAPDRDDPEAFPTLADNWVSHLTSVFVPELDTAISAVEAAEANALAAASSAYASSVVAALQANYKGEWSTLSGPLNIPASVTYAGSVWVLLQNVANVALSTPVEGATWTRYQSDSYSMTHGTSTVGEQLARFEALLGLLGNPLEAGLVDSPNLHIAGNAAYHRGNVLGVLGMTSGVPTGALMESSVETNGTWYRYADGTQVCHVQRTETRSATGNVATTVTFPKAFMASGPNIGPLNTSAVQPQLTILAGGITAITGQSVSAITNTNCVVNLNRTNTTATSFALTVYGRWA